MAQSNVNILTESHVKKFYSNVNTKLFVYEAICYAKLFVLPLKDIQIKIAEIIVQSRSKINLSCENILLKC